MVKKRVVQTDPHYCKKIKIVLVLVELLLELVLPEEV
jgi:hypothetical protein